MRWRVEGGGDCDGDELTLTSSKQDLSGTGSKSPGTGRYVLTCSEREVERLEGRDRL
jgi:hypothetical protein